MNRKLSLCLRSSAAFGGPTASPRGSIGVQLILRSHHMVPLLREAGYPRVSTMNQSPEVRTLYTLARARCKARLVVMVSTLLIRSPKFAPSISRRRLSFRPRLATVTWRDQYCEFVRPLMTSKSENKLAQAQCSPSSPWPRRACFTKTSGQLTRNVGVSGRMRSDFAPVLPFLSSHVR